MNDLEFQPRINPFHRCPASHYVLSLPRSWSLLTFHHHHWTRFQRDDPSYSFAEARAVMSKRDAPIEALSVMICMRKTQLARHVRAILNV